jgi:transposase
MYEYKSIIYRLQQGQTVRSIQRDKLAGRDKIKEIQTFANQQGWLVKDCPLPDEAELKRLFSKTSQSRQNGTQSAAEPFKEKIELWVSQGVQASTIHAHLSANHQFTGSYDSIRRYVQRLKGTTAATPLTIPLHFQPGEAAQVDFGKGPRLFDERTNQEEDTWFFLMTLCWSRHQYVEFVTHQDVETWLSCHQNAFQWFGGVVKKMIIDNAKCAITKANYYEPYVQRSYEAFAQDYGFIISACPPYDPQKKGTVESGVKYVKKNFLPLRTFTSIQDANRQVKEWVLSVAGNRDHGSTAEKPLTRFTQIEKFLLKPLPATPPEIATWHKVMLYRNCHVMYNKSFYSAPHTLYGKELWLKQTPATVTVYYNHAPVAQHPRLFQAGTYSTLNEHLPHPAQAYIKATPEWCLEQSKRIGPSVEQIVQHFLNDQTRDLLRAAQGVIRLSQTYGETRLDKACQRMLHFNVISYAALKSILSNGLDYEMLSEEQAFDALGSAYQGKGVFQRVHTKEIQ